MSKTEKELAFLRDLYLENDWTQRFAEIFDKNFKFNKEEKILYVNAGTGTHALVLREKLDDKKEVFGLFENEETLKIAQAKADAVNADVNFSDKLPAGTFDAVLADASLVKPANFNDFLSAIVQLSKDQVAVFLPTKGSFGEIFSFLWETLFDLGLAEKGSEVENLINELPTVEDVKEKAESLGLSKIETVTKIENFDFKNGAEFVESPLVADFLFPGWFGFLSEKEKEKVSKKLAKLVDDEDGSLSFRFSVKATLLVGEKK
jgi:ubiquinone/menaquinone biosynthesis C-methylase UbiE